MYKSSQMSKKQHNYKVLSPSGAKAQHISEAVTLWFNKFFVSSTTKYVFLKFRKSAVTLLSMYYTLNDAWSLNCCTWNVKKRNFWHWCIIATVLCHTNVILMSQTCVRHMTRAFPNKGCFYSSSIVSQQGCSFYDLDFIFAGIFLKKLVFSKQPLFLESVFPRLIRKGFFFADFSKA